MLVVNKLAISAFPAPHSLLFCQLCSSSVFLWGISCAHFIRLEELPRGSIKSHVAVSVTFLVTLYSNVKILQYANVETFIVFRSSTPLLIALLDYLYLGRELPSYKSTISLLCLTSGSLLYVYTDSQFEVRAYMWVLCWYLVFCFDQIYIKRVVDHSNLSPWSSSFYTNAFASIPSLIFVLSGSERNVVFGLLDPTSTCLIILSCLVGVMMSVSSFHLRATVSATYFTVIGTVCKILSVLINYLIWEKHASPLGLLALLFCIGSAMFYRQAPLRKAVKAVTPEPSRFPKYTWMYRLLCLIFFTILAAQSGKLSSVRQSNPKRPLHSKTLVVVIGSIRGGHYAWESFQRHVIDAHRVDFAYLGPDDPQLMTHNVVYDWHYDDLEDWGEFFDDMVGPSKWRYLCSEFPRGGAQFLGGVRDCQDGSAAILLVYRELLYRLIQDHGLHKKYDWFMVTRSDQIHLCEHQTFDSFDRRAIHIPEGEDYGGVSDRHTIYPASIVLDGLGVTRALLRKPRVFLDHFNRTGAHMNLESVLHLYFKMSNLHVVRFRRTFFGVIRDCDKTRWSRGVFHPVSQRLGLKVKYPTELHAAEKACETNFSIPNEPIVYDCEA